MSANRTVRPKQMPLRLCMSEQSVTLAAASERDLIVSIAALLRAAAKVEPDRVEREGEHHE